MDRRTFLAASAMGLALPRGASAMAGTDTSPEEIVLALAREETVFLDVFATDCAVCAAQAQVIAALQENSPGLAEAVSFLSLDFDAHGTSLLAQALQVTEPGTLIVLKKEREFGRLVGETDVAAIRDLVATAFGVATT